MEALFSNLLLLLLLIFLSIALASIDFGNLLLCGRFLVLTVVCSLSVLTELPTFVVTSIDFKNLLLGDVLLIFSFTSLVSIDLENLALSGLFVLIFNSKFFLFVFSIDLENLLP